MRIMTPSSDINKGLIAIIEADKNAPQEINFCVPIPKYEASDLKSISDLRQRMSNGISTKIFRSGEKQTIYLDLDFSFTKPDEISFKTNLHGLEIPFYLSPANFLISDLPYLDRKLEISHFYSGSQFPLEFADINFLLLQPNWKRLDDLYKKSKIIFTDFKY